MASVQTSKYDGRYLKLTVTEESTSTENNTSTVKWILESTGGNSNYYNIYSCEVKINNTTVYGPTTKAWDSKVFPAAKGSTSGTVTINHNPDGTANPLPFSLRGSIYNNNPKTYSNTLTLSTIPRASEITVADAGIGSGTSIMINKASDSFTTTLKYKKVGESNWREPAIVTKSDFREVYPWTVPTSLYSEIPNSQTIRCEFIAETYSGNTLVGSKTTTATFTATGNPTIGTKTATDINPVTAQLTTGASTSTIKMVKYASNVQISVSATAQNSAYISSVTVNGSNVSLDGTSTSTTRSGTITFNGATTNTFTIVATDSRGYPTSNPTLNTLAMVDYVPLTINANISRHTPVDNLIDITINGNYYDDDFRTNVSNSLAVEYRYKENGGSTWLQDWTNSGLTLTTSGNTYTATGQLASMDYTKAYQFEVRAMDEIYGSSNPISVIGIIVPKGKPIFNWTDGHFNVNGTLGVGGETNLHGLTNNGGVELYGSTPYIDFHYNNSTSDYTNRIIENESGKLEVSGKMQIDNGIFSRGTGQVGTPVGNSCLIVKRATNSEAPNNGVVLEFGNSTSWTGQLFIGDNATQGIWYNGWSNGVRGIWTKLTPLLTETGSGIVNRSSGGTLNSSNYARFGNVVTLVLEITTTSSTSAGSNAFTGTISDVTLRPKISANGTSYNGSSGLLGYIDSNGDITIRDIASTLSSDKTFNIVFTYVI